MPVQTQTTIDQPHWQERLDALAKACNVPGAVLGISRLHEEPVFAGTGVLNLSTDVDVTIDSVFQIGSISKVWTTTLVMQLVDEGLIDLDAPLVEVMPDLQLSDPEATKTLTMRHLLTHRSGLDGDVFTDTGRGDDCLRVYSEDLHTAAQIYSVGATFSYCNSGFILAGRVIEVLTGKTWDEVLYERIVKPLGLTQTVTLPEDAMLYRTAVGHIPGENDAQVRTPVWTMPRSCGPAGTISATAADVILFAEAHLRGGVAADGTRILSEASTVDMAAEHSDIPDPFLAGDSWGLGWVRFSWDGQDVFGHDGSTIGQSAFLRILPSQNLVVTLVTNGGARHNLYMKLFKEIFAEVAGIKVPSRLQPPSPLPVVDLSRFVGSYQSSGMQMDIYEADGRPMVRRTLRGPSADLMDNPVAEFEMTPISEDRYAIFDESEGWWLPLSFYTLPSGEQFVHHCLRASPKVP